MKKFNPQKLKKIAVTSWHDLYSSYVLVAFLLIFFPWMVSLFFLLFSVLFEFTDLFALSFLLDFSKTAFSSFSVFIEFNKSDIMLSCGSIKACSAILWYVMLCYVVLCYVMLCYVMLYYAMLWDVMLWDVMLCNVM